MSIPIEKEITELFGKLSPERKQQVLDFARGLADEAPPHGVPGKDLIVFGGSIPLDDLEQMRRAIEQGCEAVNLDEW